MGHTVIALAQHALAPRTDHLGGHRTDRSSRLLRARGLVTDTPTRLRIRRAGRIRTTDERNHVGTRLGDVHPTGVEVANGQEQLSIDLTHLTRKPSVVGTSHPPQNTVIRDLRGRFTHVSW